MHAVFKDRQERIVDCRVDVLLLMADEWLSSSSSALVCEVYEDDTRVRGRLVATYVRDTDSGRWSRA